VNPPPRAELKGHLELFPYGLMVAAAMEGQIPVAIVLTWAMQVSFDPPLVAAAIERTSRMREAIRTSGSFTLSFLPKTRGMDLAKTFLQSSRMSEPERMPLQLSPSRAPVVEGALAWLSCRVRQEITTGDHDTVIGEVIDSGGSAAAGDVLLLSDTGWHYRR